MNTRRNLLLATTTTPTTWLQFPVYLVDGHNGQLGIDVYNYLRDKYPDGSGTLSEEIYVNSIQITQVFMHATVVTLSGFSDSWFMGPGGNLTIVSSGGDAD